MSILFPLSAGESTDFQRACLAGREQEITKEIREEKKRIGGPKVAGDRMKTGEEEGWRVQAKLGGGVRGEEEKHTEQGGVC